MTLKFRIRDLLAGKTVFESNSLDAIEEYFTAHHQPGVTDWAVQYRNAYGWHFASIREVRRALARRAG